jgi:hypothetical protein
LIWKGPVFIGVEETTANDRGTFIFEDPPLLVVSATATGKGDNFE